MLTTFRLILLSVLILPVDLHAADDFQTTVAPLLTKYCVACHGDEEANGNVNFQAFHDDQQINAGFETWHKAIQHIQAETMPPAGERRPTPTEKSVIGDWYHSRFVDNVQPHPGFFRPRRLCAVEYRNTLHSLLGFDLEVAIVEAEQTVAERSLVMKLLPTDPPGASGFTNDTSGNPLTATAWDQYSYLADNGLSKLFSPQHRHALEAWTGPLATEYLTPEQAATFLERFAEAAHRRPLSDAQRQEHLSSIAGLTGVALHKKLRLQLKTLLMSPTFLYRGLRMNIPSDSVQPVDEFELAERLSYFLWGNMPDDELLQVAASGQLRQSSELTAQIDRMLAGPKARHLANDLGVQWFSLKEIEKTSNNPPVADALLTQPVDFLHYLFTANRPITELVDSRTTFINPLTAKYYPQDRSQARRYRKQRGIEVEAVANQKITLTNTPERGGLLTMPGILAMNRGPVLRGTWILERILGDHLPDPPADVGQVKPNRDGATLTFRQRFEQHRSNSTCAVCHDKIDPLGFALQAYDAGGSFQKSKVTPRPNKQERKDDPSHKLAGRLDTSGRLPTGESFKDFEGLKAILVTSQKEQVIRTVVRRMLAYALCRRLEYYDRPAVESIVQEMVETNGTFRDLILRISTSLPFQKTVVTSLPSQETP